MAVTEQTRTSLIGLSVVMLGSAPGTGRLNEWVDAIDDGMSLEDIANHIAASDAFTTTYPTFLTNEEFATAFLNNLMGGENVPADLVPLAVGLVTGLLNDGMTRGELAVAVFQAMYDIHAQGADHVAYGDLGMVANGLFNKIEVAEHYTLTARMADPSSDVLASVSSDDATRMAAIEAIDNPPAPPESMEGQNFVLTPTIDDFTGGDNDDTFVAQPVQGADGLFNATLNSFDSIDGGAGNDSIHIFGVDPRDTLRLGAEDISNVENVVISTVGSIDAKLGDWTGLESVSLKRFGRDDETTVDVTVDGATVSSDRPFNGDVTIIGADGAVNLEAGSGSDVHVGSAGHTETVTVKGGMSVTVDNGGGRQSQTVTSVSVDGVARDMPEVSDERSTERSHYNLRTDFDGFVLAPDGNRVVLAGSVTGTVKVEKDDDSKDAVDMLNAAGTAIQDGASQFTLQYDPVTGKLNWAPNDGTPADATVPDLPTSTASMERVEYFPLLESGGGDPTLKAHSDSIETVHLHNTTAIVAVINQSKTADGKNMAEDLSVTVDNYGSRKSFGDAENQPGKLCIGGSGSAENIDIMVEGDSDFNLASGKVKTIDISGDGRLVLGVNNFKEDKDPSDDGVSKTLESVTVSGAGGVSMTGLSGMSKLATIDASASSGDNTFRSQAGSSAADSDQLASLTTVMGGSGKDSVTLRTSVTGKLESIDTGDGNDSVTVTGMLRKDGLTVDLGAGDDSYSGRTSNSESRIDGGDGTDTLHLTTTADSTFRDADNKVQSIYTGFETLNVAGGSGDYDIAQLGIVNDVLVTASTMSAVTLENMADGMGIRVHGVGGRGPGRSTDTVAEITHELAERQSGQPRSSGELDVHLLAQGRNDTKVSQMGVAELTLTTGEDIEVINISSNANPHSAASTPGSQRASARHYQNKLDLTSTDVEELIIDGNARLLVSSGDFDSLELVDARDNSGGIIYSAADDGSGAALTQDLELVGGSGVDTLTGGDGADEIEGGLGGDTLTGGLGADDFVIDSASESLARFAIVQGVNTLLGGHDTIVGFALNEDQIDLSRSLLSAVSGDIKNTTGADGEWNDWQLWDSDSNPATAAVARYTSIDGDADVTDGAARNLATFIGNGNGLFESREDDPDAPDVGAGQITEKYSIAVVSQVENAGTEAGSEALQQGIWLLFDVNGNGDYDADADMVIFLQGTPYSETDWNATGSGADIFI